jgi:hypothetical protein
MFSEQAEGLEALPRYVGSGKFTEVAVVVAKPEPNTVARLPGAALPGT